MTDFLKELWNDLTFKGYRRPPDLFDIAITVLIWVVVLLVLALIVAVVAWIAYTLFRVIAYDYEVVTLFARVTGKEYEPEYVTYTFNPALKIPTPTTHDAEYNVRFVTDNGLSGTIDDEDLYDWAMNGSRFTVVMKIGRARSEGRDIKYWRVIRYSWY